MDTQYIPIDLNPAATEEAALRNQPPAPSDDPFTDELFAPLDLRGPRTIADQLSQLPPDQPTNAPPAPVEEDPGPPQPPAPPQPEVIEYQDGSSIVIEKTNKGWRASLDSGTSAGPEVFYGRTKDEMWTNLAEGKIHATRHIRDLNKKLKLTVRAEPLPAFEPTPIPQIRALTADDTFQIKNQLVSDPGLAFENWFQKKTGLKVEELVQLASEGSDAKHELEAEVTAKIFKSNHPEYVADDQNYDAMVGYLSKYKLGVTMNDSNRGQILSTLYHRGLWTVQNLEEAFDELTEAGLLRLEQEDDEVVQPVTAPIHAAPAQTPIDSRIANVRRGPRAGLGIRGRETTPTLQNDSSRPLTVEAMDNMNDSEIQALFAGVRRHVSQTRR